MPALALQMLPQAHAPWMTERPSEKGVSCGRSKYFKSFQLFWVPRKIFISNSTSRPSSANKPSCIATKSFNPMPFGATETLIVIERLQRADKVTFVQLVVYCATLGRQGEHSDVDGAPAALMAIDGALQPFYKAIELDPDFASAYGMAAWCYGWRKIKCLDRRPAERGCQRPRG